MNKVTCLSIATTAFFGFIFSAQGQNSATREFEILKQLSTQPASAGLSVPDMLNQPGNEKLKSFFLTPIKDTQRLKGKKIAVIASDGFEEIELTGPVWYFKSLGATIDIVAPKYKPAPGRYGLTHPEMEKNSIMAIQYLTPVGWLKVDRTADQIKVEEYDAIFIPGGAWNPDNLRYDKDVIKFVQDFYKSGRLTAAICHAPLVFASAGILKGKKLTGYWNIQSDLVNAGGSVSDVPVVVDQNLITSRHPIDVADFSLAVADWLSRHQ
ncbi:DJ-1/PfpI family protein [Spirosoma harenae]